jgi:hypothetical protein
MRHRRHPVLGTAGAVSTQPESGGRPGQEGPTDRGNRSQTRRRDPGRPVQEAKRGTGRPLVRCVPAQLHRTARRRQRGLRHGVRRIRDRPGDRSLERRTRLPDPRRRPWALHRLRGVRQRERRPVHHLDRRRPALRGPVRGRDQELPQPPQPARLLRHRGQLGMGPRQPVHGQHRRRGHGQRHAQPTRVAPKPRPLREQCHRRQQPGLLPVRPGWHLPAAVPAPGL